MKYKTLREIFIAHESSRPLSHLTGYITFSSFGPNAHSDYPLLSRTYVVSSDNKAFRPNRGGYSIFGSSLDGTDLHVRLEDHMAEERGGKDGWIVEDCCLIGYQLVGSSERDLLEPQLFYSHKEAADVMLWELCRAGSRNYEDVKAVFDRQGSAILGDNFEVSYDSAWLNGSSAGNWDWKIQMVRIHDPLRIAFGNLTDAAAESAGNGNEH